jgi:hypothetical protein
MIWTMEIKERGNFRKKWSFVKNTLTLNYLIFKMEIEKTHWEVLKSSSINELFSSIKLGFLKYDFNIF